jgi:TDG/mug DNA glycosylase family protein
MRGDRIVRPWKPTQADFAAARSKTIPDVIAPHLRVLFCGINPGLYSAAIGHHFGRPGNRFWPTLHLAGFTTRLLSPFEDRELLKSNYGITNLADRTTASADELTQEELIAGARRLVRKIARYQPTCVAFLGITAFRLGFERKQTVLGRQAEKIAGSEVWVLPNPSGLNAHYQSARLVELFVELRQACDTEKQRFWHASSRARRGSPTPPHP